jgi:hypothetical protein
MIKPKTNIYKNLKYSERLKKALSKTWHKKEQVQPDGFDDEANKRLTID